MGTSALGALDHLAAVAGGRRRDLQARHLGVQRAREAVHAVRRHLRRSVLTKSRSMRTHVPVCLRRCTLCLWPLCRVPRAPYHMGCQQCIAAQKHIASREITFSASCRPSSTPLTKGSVAALRSAFALHSGVKSRHEHVKVKVMMQVRP